MSKFSHPPFQINSGKKEKIVEISSFTEFSRTD